MKLKENIKISETIEVLTGLHIGAGNEAIEIGGLDNQVIKNPKNNEPYIPGSSLKGKMRFISEWSEDKIDINGGVHNCNEENCSICTVFGSLKATEKGRGPTRLIVRDANLIGDFDPEKMLEVKYGTAIDRITGTAKGGSLRNIERVTPGTCFSFEIVYRVLDMGNNDIRDEDNFSLVVKSLIGLENDTLGGSGSRGCGKIAFKNIEVESKTFGGEYKNLEELYNKVK
ncbi:MAG TPA: type III-A CRISPR-associated RAMP protein Csm3 [Treponemataceae bacterium]|nr:type III-A CRISPR-associated RAMP protein Csm3 [Treponemataceae bacterium]